MSSGRASSSASASRAESSGSGKSSRRSAVRALSSSSRTSWSVPEGEQSAEQAAAAVEFALEGLYLTRRLAKDTDGTRTVYGA